MNQNSSGKPVDRPAGVKLISAMPAVSSIDQVVAAMESLDGVLLPDDGVKWFNLLYLQVTRAVRDTPPTAGWADPLWLAQLDVNFAQLYFEALTGWETDPASVSRAWAALFESRFRSDIQRVQFALAGMNAHINRDLPLALVTTCEDLLVTPDRASPMYQDFETVNGILDRVEPAAQQFLATGMVGEIAQDLGALTHVLSTWSLQTARDTAWTNADLIWQLRALPGARDDFLLVLDRMTGFAGRGLLTPVYPNS